MIGGISYIHPIHGHACVSYLSNESYIQYILKVSISNTTHQTYPIYTMINVWFPHPFAVVIFPLQFRRLTSSPRGCVPNGGGADLGLRISPTRMLPRHFACPFVILKSLPGRSIVLFPELYIVHIV